MRQETYGPIAPGMTKKVIVVIRLPPEAQDSSKVKEEIQIMTKNDIFKLPVEAVILGQADFDNQNNESMQKTGKSIGNSRLRTRLADSINMSKTGGVMAQFKEQLSQENNTRIQDQKVEGMEEEEEVYGDMEQISN